MILALSLALVPDSVEDRSDRLLSEGVVRGDIEQVTVGLGLQTTKLVDQGLAGHPEEERADDVRIDDIGEGVASFGEPTDVIPQGLAGLLLAALEVPGVPRADIRPLEIPDEDSLEVRPVVDAVVWAEFEPHSNMFPHVDEVVIIHSPSSAGELEVFEPNTEVCLPGVFGNVGGRLEALWERHSLDASAKSPWSRAIRAGTPVVWPATMPRVRFTVPLDGPTGARATYPHRCPMDVIVIPGLMPVVDDAASVSVRTEAFAHWRSAWSGRWVRPWCGYGLLCHARRL